MADVTRMVVGLGLDPSDFNRGLNQATSRVQGFGSMLLRAGGVAGVGALFGGAIRGAIAFGDEMAKVNSLIGNTAEVDRMAGAVRKLSKEFGRATSEETEALFVVVREGARTAERAIADLANANTLARATFSTVAESADAVATIFDAYGGAAGKAADVTDKLFVATKVSERSLAELAGSLGDLAPFASAAGVGLEQLLAAIATMTSRGASTTRAMAGLRQVINGLIDPSKEARELAKKLGIDFSLAGLQAKGFGNFMKEIAEKTKNSVPQMQVFFGSIRELAPALALAANSGQVFASMLDQVTNSSGAAAAANAAIAQKTGEAFRKLKAEAGDALLSLGDALAGPLLTGLKALRDNLDLVAIAAGGLALALGAAKFGGAIVSAISSLRILNMMLRAGQFADFTAGLASVIPGLSTLQAGFIATTGAAKGFWLAVGLPVTAAVVAIGLIAKILLEVRDNAREAKAAIEKLKETAPTMTRFELLNDIEKTTAKLKELEKSVGVAPDHPLFKTLATIKGTSLEIDVLRQNLDTLYSAWNKTTSLMEKVVVHGLPGRDAPLVDTDLAKKQLEELQERASALLRIREQDATASAERLAAISRGVFDKVAESTTGLPQAIVTLYEQVSTLASTARASLSPLAADLGELRDGLKEAGETAKRTISSIAAARKTLGGLDPTIPATALRRALPTGAKILIPVGLIPPKPSEVTSIQQAIQRLASAQEGLDFAQLVGDEALSKKLGVTIANARALLISYGKTITEVYDAGRMSAKEFEAEIGKVNAALGAGGAAAGANKVAEGIDAAVQAGRGLVGIADGFDKIGDNARQALTGVLDLTQGITAMIAAKGALAGILSGGVLAAGGVIQIAMSVLGESEAEKEANRLRKENTERIVELTQAVRGVTISLGSQAQVAAFTSSIQTRPFKAQLPDAGGLSDEFRARLAEFGLTFADVKKIAKELGIEFKSVLDFLAFGGKQLGEALKYAIEALSTFNKHLLADVKTMAELRRRVLGEETPEAELNLGFLETLAPELFKKFFAGIDLSDGLDATELAAAKKGLRALTEAFLRGDKEIAALFGDIVDKTQLTELILGVADGFDKLIAATNELAGAMLNVPKILKVQRLVFEAQRFSTPPVTTQATVPTVTTWTPSIAQQRAAAQPVTTETVIHFHLEAGAIVVRADGGEPDEIASTVLGSLQRVAQARFGDARRWSEVN